MAINLGGTTDIEQFKGSEKTEPKPTRKVTRKVKIIELMKGNPSISRAEISIALGIHESSVKRRLESLMSDGLVRRVGPDNGDHWEVIEQ